jgi:uncharacterized membrane protein YeaQ/YmgE (transglycosylase-associated protein family)
MSERRFALVDFTYKGKTGRVRLRAEIINAVIGAVILLAVIGFFKKTA